MEGAPSPPSTAAPEPLRSIGEVVALLAPEYPDVTPSSLRFLEREGLVVPRRTPGGHRLYGENDVARLRRVKRWQRERLSLAEIRQRLTAADLLPPPQELAQAFLEEALAGRSQTARRTLVEAYEAGMPLERLFQDVLRPALYALGDRWAAGQLSVGQEHEVSALARDVVGELSRVSLSESGASQGGPGVVAACVPGETHDLGLRMAAGVWADHGYRVHYLGADVPLEAILDAVRSRRASVLLLSCALERHLPALESVLRAVAGLPAGERPRVIAGGQAVGAHREAVRALGAEPVLDLVPPP
jgi:DNA-binding transcriptional MerR regulator/methylmalonyl-CoA mutase cobalamin-binding subunit